VNGLPRLIKENKKSSKGSSMIEYVMECNECGNTTAVFSYEPPEFCPICGRRAEAEEKLEQYDWEDDE